MRPKRSREKKLAVAFHFQFSNQAAWRCDECKRSGLDARRGCRGVEAAGVVWARGRHRIHTCPKTYVTADSMVWLEMFQVGKLFGFGDVMALPARAVDAFCVLEQEFRAERVNDNK